MAGAALRGLGGGAAARPDDPPAHAALARFRAAVSGVMDEAAGDEAIVAHGTVISLLLAAAGNGPAWEIWRSLRLPDHVVVDWPGLRRIEG